MVVVSLLVTDMLYPVIAVPGRVNGGLHEMLTVEELMKEEDKSPTANKGPFQNMQDKQVKFNNNCITVTYIKFSKYLVL